MKVIRKQPSEEYWSRRSLSFSADEIAAIVSGKTEKIVVMTPSWTVFRTITRFDNIIASMKCKGDYYVARYKAEDHDY